MKQVFIADTHFGHDKFHSDNWEYKFWKKYNNINQDFILYHLGDLSFIHNHEYLNNKIDKAIEWVHEHISKYNCKGITIIDWDNLSNPNDLLEILGDKENDNNRE